MNYIVSYKNIRWGYLVFTIIVFALLGCNQNEDINQTGNKTIAVPIEINGFLKINNTTKSIDTQPHTVNRVLILPFKKTDESILTNDDNDFDLDQTRVKQVELTGSPTFLTMLELAQGSTYKILAVGYNNNDYDIDNPDMDKKFDLLYTTPNMLNTLHYDPVSATYISDIFTAAGISYNGTALVGEYFKPEGIKTLRINLTRSVSGLSIEITNVPAYVTSITLVAERLVKNTFLPNMEHVSILDETANDNLKTFSTQTSVAGNITFDHYLLPTFEANNTRFYLDVKLGTITERYLVKVNNVTGVSLDNYISFYPNQVVKIAGDYANINLGFTLNYSINLEDDNWDGIQ